MLRAKTPEAKNKRLKLFLYGSPGIGKTLSALQFPNSYVIDCERGTDFYSEIIKKNGSVVFQSNNPDEIREEIRLLLTEEHPYKTLIIDPITQVYNSVQEKWTRVFEKHAKTEKEAEIQDFGMRYWGRVKSEFKAIQRMFMALDLNVIITSHQKDIYGAGMTKIGVGPDSMKGDEYLFDLVFNLQKVGEKRMAKTIKERSEVGKNKFPEEFEWSYANFLQFYGKEIIERESAPVPMATFGQVELVKKLVEVLKVEDATVVKWFQKADCDSWEEMTKDQIGKAIGFLQDKITAIAPEVKSAEATDNGTPLKSKKEAKR